MGRCAQSVLARRGKVTIPTAIALLLQATLLAFLARRPGAVFPIISLGLLRRRGGTHALRLH